MIQERLNSDLSQQAIMQGAELPWISSPLAGVERRPLYRVGGEQARATSLVRYAPGSSFNAHVHSGGEEILVLEGVFEDEHGRYPAGTYLRNPPGSQHSPGASSGCMIFVRLRQFHTEDYVQSVVHLQAQDSQVLFESEHERVWVLNMPPGSYRRLANLRGLEVLVLEGELTFDELRLKPLSWLRLPPDAPLATQAGKKGARIWIKDARQSLGL